MFIYTYRTAEKYSFCASYKESQIPTQAQAMEPLVYGKAPSHLPTLHAVQPNGIPPKQNSNNRYALYIPYTESKKTQLNLHPMTFFLPYIVPPSFYLANKITTNPTRQARPQKVLVQVCHDDHRCLLSLLLVFCSQRLSISIQELFASN